MYKSLSVAALALVGLTVSMYAEDAFAQRGRANLGIPKPHYGSGAPGTSMGRSSGGFGSAMAAPRYARPAPIPSSQPALAYSRPVQADSYRLFSFEPLGINPGETAVVDREGARLMYGPNVVGDLPQGAEFRVTRIVNGWLGAVIERDGRQLKGWVWNGDVRPADETPPAPPAG
jgi:hypothetical protein